MLQIQFYLLDFTVLCNIVEKVTPQYGPANRKMHESTKKEKQKEEQASTSKEENEMEAEAAKATNYDAPEYWDEDKSPEGYTYYWNTVTGGNCILSVVALYKV